MQLPIIRLRNKMYSLHHHGRSDEGSLFGFTIHENENKSRTYVTATHIMAALASRCGPPLTAAH